MAMTVVGWIWKMLGGARAAAAWAAGLAVSILWWRHSAEKKARQAAERRAREANAAVERAQEAGDVRREIDSIDDAAVRDRLRKRWTRDH